MNYKAIIDQGRREQKQHGTPLFPVARYHESMFRRGVPWHWHNELEAVVVERGTALFVIDGKKYRIEQGQGVFLNADVLHSSWAGDNRLCVLRTLVFHPRLIGGVESIFWEKYLRPLVAGPSVRWLHLDGTAPWHEEAIAAIDQAWEQMGREEPGFEFAVRNALSRLVFLVGQNSQQKKAVPTDKVLRDITRIKQMLQYVEEHLADELTVAAIAESANLSESECLRCFRTMVNTAPIQYVKKLRLQRAAILLETTDWKVSDIAAQCGFQEMSYFSKSFRQWTGVSPSKYREKSTAEE